MHECWESTRAAVSAAPRPLVPDGHVSTTTLTISVTPTLVCGVERTSGIAERSDMRLGNQQARKLELDVLGGVAHRLQIWSGLADEGKSSRVR